jgi:hypothetical protein
MAVHQNSQRELTARLRIPASVELEMTTLASKPVLRKADAPANAVLLLRATDDGWALVDARGEVLFSAEGHAGRQACLAFARAQGVLALIR